MLFFFTSAVFTPSQSRTLKSSLSCSSLLLAMKTRSGLFSLIVPFPTLVFSGETLLNFLVQVRLVIVVGISHRQGKIQIFCLGHLMSEIESNSKETRDRVQFLGLKELSVILYFSSNQTELLKSELAEKIWFLLIIRTKNQIEPKMHEIRFGSVRFVFRFGSHTPNRSHARRTISSESMKFGN